MTGAVQLTWQNFEAYYLSGPPREVILPGASRLRLFVANQDGAFGMRVPLKARTKIPASPIAAISIRGTRFGGAPAAEIFCVPGAASKEFFYFLLAVADGIQLKGLAFPDAFDDAVKTWRELLRGLARMSEEEELGLFGELLTLQLLVGILGPRAVGHWTGPATDQHDFRIRLNEFEVKTTSGAERIHIINGLHQLTPSLKCRLYIVSWQLERAGADSGETLPERIANVRKAMKSEAGALSRFDELLEKGTRWQDAGAQLYPEHWRPRSSARLILVDRTCPRITSSILASGLLAELATLISDVRYRINLEGHGIPIESDQFKRIVQKGRP
jgi:hypothetical protein